MVCPNGTVLKRPTDAEAGVCLGITPELDPGQALRRRGGRRRARRAWRPRSMPPPRACRCWCSTSARSAARRAPRRGSRTISAFRPASRARRWPGAPSTRRRNSAPRSPSRSRSTRLDCDGRRRPPRPLRLELANGDAVQARTVVVASGARYRRPEIPNLADFEGAGVSYWASPIEAKLCEGEEVALVGGGNSAGQAVVFLAPKVRHLHLDRARRRARGDDVALSDRPDLALCPMSSCIAGRRRSIGLEGLVPRLNSVMCAQRGGQWRSGRDRSSPSSSSSAPSRTRIGWGLRRRRRQRLCHHRSGLDAGRTSSAPRNQLRGVFAIGDLPRGFDPKRVAAAVGRARRIVAQIPWCAREGCPTDVEVYASASRQTSSSFVRTRCGF